MKPILSMLGWLFDGDGAGDVGRAGEWWGEEGSGDPIYDAIMREEADEHFSQQEDISAEGHPKLMHMMEEMEDGVLGCEEAGMESEPDQLHEAWESEVEEKALAEERYLDQLEARREDWD